MSDRNFLQRIWHTLSKTIKNISCPRYCPRCADYGKLTPMVYCGLIDGFDMYGCDQDQDFGGSGFCGYLTEGETISREEAERAKD